MTAGRRAGMRYKKAGKTRDQQWILCKLKKVKRHSRFILFFIRSELWVMMDNMDTSQSRQKKKRESSNDKVRTNVTQLIKQKMHKFLSHETHWFSEKNSQNPIVSGFPWHHKNNNKILVGHKQAGRSLLLSFSLFNITVFLLHCFVDRIRNGVRQLFVFTKIAWFRRLDQLKVGTVLW
jgi:hypothetical protein